jgi:hypothetical protein
MAINHEVKWLRAYFNSKIAFLGGKITTSTITYGHWRSGLTRTTLEADFSSSFTSTLD